MAMSTWVAHEFEWEKLLKCHLKGKASKKLSNGQNIDYSEKRKRPKGFICPCTGVKYHNIQTCLLVYAADSGERLQDHWSSGYTGHLRYLKLGCLEKPTYDEVITHSRPSLPICYCISTLLVSNLVMTKTRLCRSDNLLPTEKILLVSPFLCRTLK